MIFAKNFTTGLITGAVVGSIVGMVIDPIKDKDSNKIKKGAGSVIHSVGNIVESIADMRG